MSKKGGERVLDVAVRPMSKIVSLQGYDIFDEVFAHGEERVLRILPKFMIVYVSLMMEHCMIFLSCMSNVITLVLVGRCRVSGSPCQPLSCFLWRS